MALRALFLTLLICFFTSFCYADFEMTTGVNLHLEYNDNIYLDSDNEEDDVITTVAPNISLNWETPRLDLSLSASVSMEKYLNNTDEDNIGANSNQSSSLNALARLYRELFFLRVTDTYSRVPIDEGGRGGESNTTVNMTDSNILEINPYLQFQIMKDAQLQMGYTYTNLWYGNSNNEGNDDFGDDGGDGNDSENHLFSATLSKELSARTSTSLSGSYEEYRPKDPDDERVFGGGGTYEYDETNVSIGLSYQATERLQLQGSYGHSWLSYDVISDSDSDIWSASADYEITSNYTVGTAYSQSYVVSVEDGPSESDRLSGYLKYNERFMLNFTLFTSSSDYVEIKREDDSYGGSLSGELPFNEKTGITGLFSYENFDRDGFDAEEFDRYSTKFSLYYETRLGRVSAGYTYTNNDSDRSDEDYTNNVVFINASLKF